MGVVMTFIILALDRGWLVTKRELDATKAYAEQMRQERDAFRQQVEQRQNLVEQTMELAELLKSFAAEAKRREKD